VGTRRKLVEPEFDEHFSETRSTHILSSLDPSVDADEFSDT
jgi:hypothetical protein